jgi:hypothetical protein
LKKIKVFVFLSEDGNTLPLMAAVIILILAMSGVVVDTGLLIEGKLELHAATKAAAKATYEAYDHNLWENEGEVVLIQEVTEAYAGEYLNYNLPEAKLVSVVVTNNSPTQANAEIKTSLEVEFVFMRIFGIDTCDVETVFEITVSSV